MYLLPNEAVEEHATDPSLPDQEALGRTLSQRFKAYGADAERSIFQLVTTKAFSSPDR